MGPAGTQMPESIIEPNHCGTLASGWLNGNHPTDIGVVVDGTVCFNYGGNSCWGSSDILIMKCETYFLYFLPSTPNCPLRYCGVN